MDNNTDKPIPHVAGGVPQGPVLTERKMLDELARDMHKNLMKRAEAEEDIYDFFKKQMTFHVVRTLEGYKLAVPVFANGATLPGFRDAKKVVTDYACRHLRMREEDIKMSVNWLEIEDKSLRKVVAAWNDGYARNAPDIGAIEYDDYVAKYHMDPGSDQGRGAA